MTKEEYDLLVKKKADNYSCNAGWCNSGCPFKYDDCKCFFSVHFMGQSSSKVKWIDKAIKLYELKELLK